MSLGTGVVIVAAAWTFGPRTGRGEAPVEVIPRDPERSAAARLLAGVLESSRGILAVHPAGHGTPFLEVVLLVGPDRHRPEDLALLTFHSRMERVFLYGVAEDASARDLAAARAAVAGLDAAAADFPERWRELDAVERRTLLKDVADLEIEDTGPTGNGRIGLELRLRWAGNRTDQNEEAKIAIEAVRIAD